MQTFCMMKAQAAGRFAAIEDWLGRWAMNLMLINVSTRKLRRAVRLPEGDLPVIAADCLASNRIREQQGALPNESGSERRGLGNSRRLAFSVVCV
jgi:hypothetical protein